MPGAWILGRSVFRGDGAPENRIRLPYPGGPLPLRIRRDGAVFPVAPT